MRPVQAGKPAREDYHGCIIAGSTAPDFVPLSIIGYDGDGNTTSVTDSQGGLLTLTYDARDGVRGTPYLIPALWLSRATERDSMLARPPSESHLRALESLDFESHAPCSPPTTMRKGRKRGRGKETGTRLVLHPRATSPGNPCRLPRPGSSGASKTSRGSQRHARVSKV